MKKFLLTAFLAVSAMAAFAETYSLNIGINDYPTVKMDDGTEVDNDLNGCVNDAKAMQEVCVGKYGVKASNTRLLLDKQASGDNFLGGIKWLFSSAKAGDQVVITFSGHGAQLEDPKAADGSGFTEVIVLADDTLVQDTFFSEVANLLRVNGINATFIFDSCFSGGMNRAPGKFMVKTKGIGKIKAKGKMKANTDALAKNLMTLKPRQAAGGTKLGDTVFLFASDKDKTSTDISGLEGIPAHGIFTLLLLDALNMDKNSSIIDIFSGIDASLKEINEALMKQGKEADMKESDIPQFNQHPNFVGTAARAGKPILLP
ncbi:MAG: caspase family protein [Armatimonadetes bacterium]|nr:caspase family protein [Armatimonadota bacterium]